MDNNWIHDEELKRLNDLDNKIKKEEAELIWDEKLQFPKYVGGTDPLDIFKEAIENLCKNKDKKC